jgi:hypothetical protein
MPTPLQGLLWGILPIGSSILAMLFLLIPNKRTDELEGEPESAHGPAGAEDLVLGRILS